MRILLGFFLVIPVLEMWLLIKVGASIGAWPTIALVFLTAIVGLALLRQQGLSTLFRVNSRLESGELPAEEIAEGLFLAVGGALLLTPGFFTDAFGFACLLPFTRRWMSRRWLSHFTVTGMSGGSFHHSGVYRESGTFYEGEFTREKPDSKKIE